MWMSDIILAFSSISSDYSFSLGFDFQQAILNFTNKHDYFNQNPPSETVKEDYCPTETLPGFQTHNCRKVQQPLPI